MYLPPSRKERRCTVMRVRDRLAKITCLSVAATPFFFWAASAGDPANAITPTTAAHRPAAQNFSPMAPSFDSRRPPLYPGLAHRNNPHPGNGRDTVAVAHQ